MIVRMKRLSLIALKSDEEKILQELQKLSAVQVLSTGEAKGSEKLDALRREVERVGSARAAIKPYYKKPKFAPTPQCSADELAKSREKSRELCAGIERLEGKLASTRAEAERHTSTADSLIPFCGLETPIENIVPTRTIRYITGVADAKALERVDELGDIVNTELAVEKYPSPAGTGVIIACYALDREAIARALKETTFVEYNFPKLTGTPAKAIEAERGEAARLYEQCEGIEDELRALAKERADLLLAEDAAAIAREREENRCAMDETDYAFIMDAWARADKLEEIERAVASVTDAYHIETRDPLPEEVPPTVMKNKKLIEPYESIVEMYALPSYRGVDATAAMAPFYFLFFGMMLSDMGYGLALFIGGLLYLKLLRPRPGAAKLVRVLAYGGLSAILVSPFIGTFFGMDFDAVLGTANIFPLLFDPMIDVMQMMILSCGLGLVHMFTGIGIKMYMCFREGDWQSAIFDQFSWMLLLVGLIGIFAFPQLKTAATVLALVGAGILLIFSGRSQKNPIKRVTKGLSTLYNITGYLSDILSYVRIFALGLVSGAMGMVFNLIGSLVYDALGGLGIIGVIIGVILAAGILLLLHVFSLFINTLGAFAHTARLQFIEFFGKFYESDGVAFKPLAEKTKNVELVRDADTKTA